MADMTIANVDEQGLLLTTIADAWQQGKTKSQLQKEALREFRSAIKNIADEPIDDDFRAIVNRGIAIDSGLEL